MKYFYILLFLFLSLSGLAQQQIDGKRTIGIMPFLSRIPNDTNRAKASELRALVFEVFAQKKRFLSLDRAEASEAVKTEIITQQNEDFLNSPVLIAEGKSIGAQDIVTGILSSITSNERVGGMPGITNQRGGTIVPASEIRSVSVTISFSIIVTEVETGKTRTFQAFSVDGSFTPDISTDKIGSGSDRDEISQAISHCRNKIKKKVEEWIDREFPEEMTILRIDETDVKKGGPSLITISGGSDSNFKKGNQISVLEEQEIPGPNGQIFRKINEIATLAVDKVEGEVTQCKVKKGHQLLGEKYGAGAKLKLVRKI